jgi:alcohol dehydrogenase class IV
MTLLPFTYDALPGRVVFGVGALDRVSDELDSLPGRVFLIASGSSLPIADQIAAQFGGRLAGRFGEVAQHVPEELAERARKKALEAGADVIVAVGGGSAVGLGKAVAVHVELPLVVVPTTYSGSEMTPFYGLTGKHKRVGRDLRALPRIVIYDPALTVGLPARVTAATGFNALAHCVEGLYAPGTNPVTALLAEEGIRALGRSLPDAVERPADLTARSDALYGAYLAGAALAVAGTALHHKLCHVLGGTFGLVHGDVNAVVLPHVAAFNALAIPEVMARVSVALGGPPDSSAAAGRLADLAARIGAPTSLGAIGMPEDGIGEAAELAVASVGDSNPRPVDVVALQALLRAAFRGRPA